MAFLLKPLFIFLFSFLCSGFAINQEGEALLSFARNLILPHSVKVSWNSSHSTPCHWEGIECNNNHSVVALTLPNLGISGQLGLELTSLRFLETLDLSNNSFSGSIPISFLANFTQLSFLELSYNNFTGEIPQENLPSLRKLYHFSVFYNNLSGKVPSSLFQIPSLVSLYLSSNNLTGSIPSSVGNATKMESLWLSSNQLSGAIPPSIGNCTRLRHLYLNNNNLVGTLPESLGELQFLTKFYVRDNELEGKIPLGIGNWKHLKELVLSYNRFNGEIPPSVGNCSGLTIFVALHNVLSGQLPSSLGFLTNLTSLYLNQNQFSGKIPGEIGKCRSLTELLLHNNQLEGEIPSELGMLRNLETLELFNNFLSGEIPLAVWKIPSLVNIVVYNNSLSGELPLETVELRQLRNITLFNNHFSGVIPGTLGINTSLEQLDLTDNNFSGEIPPNLCFGRQLQVLALGLNQFLGSIPSDIGRCSSLERLILNSNNLTSSLPEFIENPNLNFIDISANSVNGTIPSSIGKCKKLTSVNLSMNKLSGSIPQELGALTELGLLNLSDNHFEGPLPPQLSNCKRLLSLDVGFNSLNGSIPSSLRGLTQLSTLTLMENQFTGGIPIFLAELENLFDLQLGGNSLGGVIPPLIGDLRSLVYHLNLSGNGLTGHVPSELAKLSLLQSLDISCNNLTGNLEPVGELPSLFEANFSYNFFNGPIPESLMKLVELNPPSFMGNPGLCVPCQLGSAVVRRVNINISCCDQVSVHRRGPNKIEIAIIALGASLVCTLVLLSLVCMFLRCRGQIEEVEVFANDHRSSLLKRVMEATEHLNERFIIGKGAHGTVYKASLGQDKLYAVKKLVFAGNKQASASMVREIETVGQIKHRNLVKLEEFWLRNDKGLILYNYMENGSLHDILHVVSPPQVLSWKIRLKIALGTAEGLAYLHYDCDPAIVHRDIKPKNILLDAEMEPHISDFGIAKLMDYSSYSVHTTSIMGTIGYMAPETAFATTKSRESDVYSYGVVLLELITRKQALDPSFAEDMDIVKWVHSIWSSTKSIHDIVDPSLAEELIDSRVVEEVMGLFTIALQCTTKEPSQRPTMREVVKQLTNAMEVRIGHK